MVRSLISSRRLALASTAMSLLAGPAFAADTPPAAVAEVVVTAAAQQNDNTRSATDVGRDTLQAQPSTNNVAQDINLAPGVNAFTKDPTGIFGGGYSIRGFDSTQIGLTLNGVTVNDQGTFTVTPQIYTDPENLCGIQIVQGATDSKANAIGSVGGTIGMSVCKPADHFGATLEQTGGSFDAFKTFVRVQSGPLLNGAASGYVSYSHAQADIFDGPGTGKRDHVDLDTVYNFGNGGHIDFYGFANQYENNLIRTVTLSQYQAFGYNNGYLAQAPTRTNFPSSTSSANIFSATTAAVPYTPVNTGYYNYYFDTGQHVFLSAASHFNLSNAVTLDVTPYFFWQYAGSSSENILTESGSSRVTPKGKETVGVADINGDGNLAQKDLIAQDSLSEWWRTGVKASLNEVLGDQVFTQSYWAENVAQHQYNPYERINTATNTLQDPFFYQGQILDSTGAALEERRWITHYLSQNAAVSYAGAFLGNRLHIDAGVRGLLYTRDFESDAVQENSTGYENYSVKRTYTSVLPSLSANFRIDDANLVFASMTENARVPANYIDENLVNSANGTINPAAKIKQEKSLNLELGYKYQGPLGRFTATLYNIDYRDRIAETVENNGTLQADYTNLGSTTSRGVEVSATTPTFHGFSAYWSGSYNDDRLDGDILATDGKTVLPTKGKQLFNAPRVLTAAALKYQSGPLYGEIHAKYTDKSYSTLLNDQAAPAYTTVDVLFGYALDMAQLFPNGAVVKSATIKVNATNILNERYLFLNPGNTPSYQITAAGNPSYYLGAPRAVMVTVAANF